MEFIGVALNWRRIGIATLLYRVQGNWLCCILNIIDLFFLTQKHIYSLQHTGCSWFVSFYKCRDITIKNMLFMSLITVRLRDPPSHKDDHRENVQNDFFFLKNYIENGFKSIDIFDWMINPSPWLSINPCLPMLTCLLCKRIWWDAI